jgi:hypothetical protein
MDSPFVLSADKNNKFSLPEPLVKALTPDRRPVVDGRYSATTLLNAPIIRILTKKHFNDIEQDVSEGLWALLGKAVHYVIEQSGGGDAEEKIEYPFNGATLVGVVDYNKNGWVIDWKLTSAWSYVFGGSKTWEKQLQIYSYLLQMTGKKVLKLSIYMIIRDWNRREASKREDYPNHPFQEINYDLWPKSKIEAFLTERVSLMQEAEKWAVEGNFESIPTRFMCTPEERWAKEETFAVMKAGQKRAVRVLSNKLDAAAVLATEKLKGKGEYSIVTRAGEQTKCEHYCVVNRWCPFFLAIPHAEGPGEA